MTLNNKQTRQLKTLAHQLKPIVMVGQHGISDNILNEIDIALDHHELIKVRISADKEERQQILTVILDHSSAVAVQMIGHIAILFRVNSKSPKISKDL